MTEPTTAAGRARRMLVEALVDGGLPEKAAAVPELPFIDDVEVFWEPFASKVIDALRERSGE